MKVTFGRNTNNVYPVRVDGQEVGFIDYGPRIGMWVWRVNDTRPSGRNQVVAWSPYLKNARNLAKKHFAPSTN